MTASFFTGDSMQIPDSIHFVLKTLEAHGFEAYTVGGAVRDMLLGKTADDWDVTTIALPQQVKACFTNYRVIETGIRHGTVTVLAGDFPVEITTYRFDGAYSDGRHPDQVAFTRSLSEDLARRDFTVNAMAYSPARGLQDPFGGMRDMEKHVLRCVGDPHKRFCEDALRILRGVRFAAVLGFELDEKTSQAIHSDCALLRQVSAERIAVELRKLLCGKAADEVINTYADVIRVCIPTLPNGFEELLPQLSLLPDTFAIRLAGLLSVMSAQDAFDVCKALRLDTRTCEIVRDTLLAQSQLPVGSYYAMKKRFGQFGSKLGGAFCLMEAKKTVPPTVLDQQRRWNNLIVERMECCSIAQLAVNGRDLMALGLRGPEIGRTLETLLDAVMQGICTNEREALLEFAGSKRGR